MEPPFRDLIQYLCLRMCISELAQAVHDRYNWTGVLLVIPAGVLVYFVVARTFRVATRHGVPLPGAQTFQAGSIHLFAIAMFRACWYIPSRSHQRRYDLY